MTRVKSNILARALAAVAMTPQIDRKDLNPMETAIGMGGRTGQFHGVYRNNHFGHKQTIWRKNKTTGRLEVAGHSRPRRDQAIALRLR